MKHLLLVEDEPLVAETYERMLRPYVPCIRAGSATEALAALATRDPSSWAGFMLDVRLESGSGIDVLEAIRTKLPWHPVLIATGVVEAELINAAARLDARYVTKPFHLREILPFLRELNRCDVRELAAIGKARWGLSPRETELLGSALLGHCTARFIEDADITENTYKTLVRRLLKKTQHGALADLALTLLRQVNVPAQRALAG